MATASRSRAPAAAKQRPRVPLAAMAAADAARSWGVPALALAVIGLLVVLSAAGALGTAGALAGTVAATLVLLLYIGERPLVTQAHTARERGLGSRSASPRRGVRPSTSCSRASSPRARAATSPRPSTTASRSRVRAARA